MNTRYEIHSNCGGAVKLRPHSGWICDRCGYVAVTDTYYSDTLPEPAPPTFESVHAKLLRACTSGEAVTLTCREAGMVRDEYVRARTIDIFHMEREDLCDRSVPTEVGHGTSRECILEFDHEGDCVPGPR